jgi:hypothetical protein
MTEAWESISTDFTHSRHPVGHKMASQRQKSPELTLPTYPDSHKALLTKWTWNAPANPTWTWLNKHHLDLYLRHLSQALRRGYILCTQTQSNLKEEQFRNALNIGLDKYEILTTETAVPRSYITASRRSILHCTAQIVILILQLKQSSLRIGFPQPN